ncbi:uncharacterized protein LOC131670871 [Phymastichus coffea]|uniref:uncharacterized protein LOC131670871 n=1 Tax=Phymastichus coffea TaxID=108790 RepID=UPI00273C79A5|nr:uncharacterized protein LOC131670871 [Phymastichus coffea]
MSIHKCPKQQCTCAEVSELTKLYRDIKCRRKRAKDGNGVNMNETRVCISAMELQTTMSQAEQALEIVRTQRAGVGNLMTALREFSHKLSKQEEMLCQANKEIDELRGEMRQIKEQYDEKRASNATDTISTEEVVWRQELDMEVREQCRLKQSKIKQLTECLERRKRCDCNIDKARQEKRKADAALLLNAIDYVEACV